MVHSIPKVFGVESKRYKLLFHINFLDYRISFVRYKMHQPTIYELKIVSLELILFE